MDLVKVQIEVHVETSPIPTSFPVMGPDSLKGKGITIVVGQQMRSQLSSVGLVYPIGSSGIAIITLLLFSLLLLLVKVSLLRY